MSAFGPYVPVPQLPPAPSGPPPGSRETTWSGFALALRATGAILFVALLAWTALKFTLYDLVLSVDPGVESEFPSFYEKPSLGEYVRGSTLLGDLVVLMLLVMADQVTRVVRRGLRGTWDQPGPGARVLLVGHAALLAGTVFWLLHPFLWGTTLYF